MTTEDATEPVTIVFSREVKPGHRRVLSTNPRMQKTIGLEIWFELPGLDTSRPPPRWKMWIVTVVMIHPLSLAFQFLVPHLGWMPVPLRALALPVVLVTAMSLAIMPVVTRLLRRWLYPGG